MDKKEALSLLLNCADQLRRAVRRTLIFILDVDAHLLLT
jgi:hypothetical protein